MRKFEYDPLEVSTGMKAIGEFNDLVALHAGIIDFVKKYEDQIDVLERHLSEKEFENLYYALAVVPKVIADLAPIVRKEFSKEEGPE